MIPILLSGLTKDGSRLVRLPKVSAGSRRESEGLPQATCDDPIYETSPSADGSHSLNKPYSVFKVKAQNSRSQLNKDVSSSSIPESQEAKDFSKVSGSSGHSSTGFGKGSSLNPEKSVVLVMENMSQKTLKVRAPSRCTIPMQASLPVLHLEQCLSTSANLNFNC